MAQLRYVLSWHPRIKLACWIVLDVGWRLKRLYHFHSSKSNLPPAYVAVDNHPGRLYNGKSVRFSDPNQLEPIPHSTEPNISEENDMNERKFATILGVLGNPADRFMSRGYKAD